MKKLIALAIAAIMVLSMIPVMAFTAFAADDYDYPEPDDGFWSVYRDPKQYELDEGVPYRPASGYEYTSDGFTIIPADFTGTTPKTNIQTSSPVDISEGFYMKVRIDDFSYRGESGSEDEWISFGISDKRMIDQGGTGWSNNWLCLIRHDQAGGVDAPYCQSFNTVKATDTSVGTFRHLGNTNITCEKDSGGEQIYELEIIPINGKYDVRVNGVTVAGIGEVSKHIAAFEECYIGISLQSGQAGGTATCTILKQGTSKSNCETPDGNDEKEPEENFNFTADMSPSTEVPANEPAFLFDGTKTSFKLDPNSSASNMSLDIKADYTYHCTGAADDCYFVWNITNEKSYEAADFPIFAMMMKDYIGDDGGVFYCSGDVLAPNNKYIANWSQWDDNARMFGGDNEYTLVMIDLGALIEETEDGEAIKKWQGRINAIRPSFGIDPADAEMCEWDICYMGFFRSVDEANAYADKYNEEKIVPNIETKPDGDDEDTKAPDPDNDEDTKAPDPDNDEATNAPDDGDDTKAPDNGETTDGTSANGTTGGDKTDETNKTDDESGCASVIGMGAVAILAAAVAAVILKKND